MGWFEGIAGSVGVHCRRRSRRQRCSVRVGAGRRGGGLCSTRAGGWWRFSVGTGRCVRCAAGSEPSGWSDAARRCSVRRDAGHVALTLGWWSAYARLARSVVLSTKEQPHIEALTVLGASALRIFGRHLVPAAIGPALVYAAGGAGLVALSVASLSFLGVGVKPPQSEWGQMLVDGTRYLGSDLVLVILPGVALTLFVVTLNVFSRSIALRSSPGALPHATVARRHRRLPALSPRAARAAVTRPDPLAKKMVSS
ncbi:ABC transporter permease [Streptomyces chartreusis]